MDLDLFLALCPDLFVARIVGKRGFSSLYNGWGAVLYRNVPHSIIKVKSVEQELDDEEDNGELSSQVD